MDFGHQNMKTRIVHTKIWEDEFFSNLTPKQKLLFMYYIINDNIGLTGIYEVTNKQTSFDTGLTIQEIIQIKELFSKNNKIHFVNNWVHVINAQKLNNFTGEKLDKAVNKELASIPEEIKNYFDTLSIPHDTVSIGNQGVSTTGDTPNNHKSEIINQKEGVVKGEPIPVETCLDYLTDIPPQDLDDFHDGFIASKAQIISKGKALHDWCLSSGKRKKDYKATLRNALRKDFGERPPKKPEMWRITEEPPIISPEKMAEIRAKKDEILRSKIL